MRAMRNLLVLVAIGTGLLLSLATSPPPAYQVQDQIDLGAIAIDQANPHQLSGRVTRSAEAAGWAPHCDVGYQLALHNTSVSSGYLHLWSLAEPFAGEIPANLEPVQSAIVRGFPAGDEGELEIAMLAPCPVSGDAFHLALTMEGGAHVEGAALLEAISTAGSQPPEGATIELTLEEP